MSSNLMPGVSDRDLPGYGEHDPRCDDWRCPDCGALAAAIVDRGWGRKQCADCGMHGEAVHFDGMQQDCICGELEPLVYGEEL